MHKEADWQKPKNHQGKWETKVKWALLEEFDVKALESNEYAVTEADEEVTQRMKQKALFAKHLTSLEESGAAKDNE